LGRRAANWLGAIPHLYLREVAIATGALLVWVAENPQFQVASMMARLRGVARRHVMLQLTFVSLASVAAAADGLVQEHIDVHGESSLIPASKEPFLNSEIVAMLELPYGTVVGGIVVGDNVEWQGVRVFIALYCTMGPRKEAVALGPGQAYNNGARTLSLFRLTYRRGAVLVKAPTVEQLRAVAMGDMVYITPPPCKNDRTGTKYGNSPVPAAYHPTRPINFMREVVKYELMRKVAPDRRRQAPLVLGPDGSSWTKKDLHAFFKALLAMVVEPRRARPRGCLCTRSECGWRTCRARHTW
jgi:hypothetical protein